MQPDPPARCGLPGQPLPANPDRHPWCSCHELHPGAATTNPEGAFETDGITVTHPERTRVSSEGYSGGQLSCIPNGSGEPRLVTGLSSMDFAESDGREASIAGAFVAPADRLSDP